MSKQIRQDICGTGNDYNGEHFEVRISSIFVVLALSAFGAFLPLVASRSPWFRVPGWVFFIIRYLGSGVIVATGFIHLLAEGNAALTEECLGLPFVDYPWSEGIALMGVFTMFFFDIVAHKKIEEKTAAKSLLETQAIENGKEEKKVDEMEEIKINDDEDKKDENISPTDNKMLQELSNYGCYGAHNQSAHNQGTQSPQNTSNEETKTYYHQILNSFVLEFGIIFHSVFVGLSLAIAGEEFVALYVAIAFHQMFEGLGLGTRFALTKWPANKQYIPWLLSLAYSLTTPIAIAIGLGVRKTYPPGSRRALITTGVFDALCGGILIYNSLVELMAYDFMYSSEFKNGLSMKRMLLAYLCLSIGAFAMALIGKWA